MLITLKEGIVMKVKDLKAILNAVSDELEVNFCNDNELNVLILNKVKVIDSNRYNLSYTDSSKITKDQESLESKICFILDK